MWRGGFQEVLIGSVYTTPLASSSTDMRPVVSCTEAKILPCRGGFQDVLMGSV